MAQIRLREDDSEIMYYNDPEVPFYVADSWLSSFPNREMLCHWHEDIEYIHALEGSMAYYVNEQEIILEAGQAVLVNSRQLHHSHACGEDDCRYLCVVFRPDILNNSLAIRYKYIDPVVNASHTPYLLLPGDAPICQCLDRAAQLHGEKAPGFELRVLGRLNQM